MTWFQVDHEALLGLAGQLDKIHTALDSTQADTESYDGDLGSGDVKNELHSFISDWSQGRGQIVDDIKQTVGYLKGAGTAYKTTDEKLAARFKGMEG
jgi:hypothetical protein